MKKTCLILIDSQNDFCNPEGSLYVPGAKNDIKNISNFIIKNEDKISNIIATMDSHFPLNITNPKFWYVGDDKNTHPLPFTIITKEEVLNGEYHTKYGYDAIPYLEHLEKENKQLILWPSHCIINTIGWLLDTKLAFTLDRYCYNTGKNYTILMKGMHPHTDQYSIFNPEMNIDDEYGEVSDDIKLIKDLSEKCDEIIFCGEAADVCCLNSIKYLVNSPLHWAEDILKKSIIFKDCMSAIDPNFNIDTDPVYVSAVEKGAKIINSTDYM